MKTNTEEKTIGDYVASRKGTKFKNGVEESVWVSFVCAIIQKPDGIDYTDTICEAADALLEAYRARLENGKPSIK